MIEVFYGSIVQNLVLIYVKDNKYCYSDDVILRHWMDYNLSNFNNLTKLFELEE